MKNSRSVEMVMAPREPHWVGDGFQVHNFIPSGPRLDMYRMDPFILLDYNAKHDFAPSASPKGVGVHPHRGFETVTFAYQGKVEHHDSSGGGGVIQEGDVQWMTAASGVLHKEYHETEWSKKGGTFQMVQLWVNLPAKYKMSPPKYQAIKQADIPSFLIDDVGSKVEVVAGEYLGIKGAATTFTTMHVYNVSLKSGAKFDLSLPAHFNTVLLTVEGKILLNDTDSVPTDYLALMANDGAQFFVEALSDAKFLVLSGEPIKEPIAAHGPFVMNTRQELMQAFEDFNNGKFGFLED